MLGRRTKLLLALAAIAALGGGTIAAVATAGGATHVHPRSHGRATVPTITARAMPPACFIAGQGCSIHPCVEFVARRLRPLLRARMVCDAYPRTKGLAVPIGP